MTNETICEIKWCTKDIEMALYNKLKREPTENEVKEALMKIDVDLLQDRSIEIGWEVIDFCLGE